MPTREDDLAWERKMLKREQERHAGTHRHPAPTLPFKDHKGQCWRCGANLTGRKLRWCGKKCINAMLREQGFSYRSDGLRANRKRHGGNLVCDACGRSVDQHRWWDAKNSMEYDAWHDEYLARKAEVDHIVRLKDGGTHDIANLQVLCVPCHVAKTAQEAGEAAEKRRLESRKERKLEEYQ